MTALSCIGLQPEDAALSGKIQICGENILDFSSSKWTDFRGKTVSMIFQEPMTSLNPVEKAGIQIAETGILHGLTKNQAEEKARMLMNELNLENSMLYHALSGQPLHQQAWHWSIPSFYYYHHFYGNSPACIF